MGVLTEGVKKKPTNVQFKYVVQRNRFRGTKSSSRSLITAMECKIILKLPYKDNKYLTIQKSLCLDLLLLFPQVSSLEWSLTTSLNFYL